MRRHLLRVSTALLVALCSACATLQPAPVDRAGVNAKWRTHHDTLASIQHFTLSSRAASGVGVKADLRWQQFDDGHFEIRIAGPFGDRKSVVWGKSVSVRLDHGGRLIHKKKKHNIIIIKT